MILCLTPNPAIDRTWTLTGELVPGEVHRAATTLIAAGGKGLNVARAVLKLGGRPLCAGFAGGYSGGLLSTLAESEGLPGVWTPITGETRTCAIVVDSHGIDASRDATVINEVGPAVTTGDWDRLQADVLRLSEGASAVCLSGSLPPGSPTERYTRLIETLLVAGRTVWVDSSGPGLSAALAVSGPGGRYGIKVNLAEAAAALGVEASGPEDMSRVAHGLIERGADRVVLTLGAGGAAWLDPQVGWWARPPQILPVSTVASGDVFLAGLVTSLEQELPDSEALRRAVGAGAANALTPGGARFSLADFERLLAETTVEVLQV